MQHHEIEYLQDLIDQFPVKNQPDAEEAFSDMKSRYQEFEKALPSLVNYFLPEDEPDRKKAVSTEHFVLTFRVFIIALHASIFENIVNNAGRYRQSDDPDGGAVMFGGSHKNIAGKGKFHGAVPGSIEQKLEKAVILLSESTDDPVLAGITFYQQFVNIHPFYDANGRIGRFLLTVYLNIFGYNVQWKKLEEGGNKTKFLKKLNECHKREENDQKSYHTYLGRLADFFKRFIFEFSEIDNEF